MFDSGNVAPVPSAKLPVPAPASCQLVLATTVAESAGVSVAGAESGSTAPKFTDAADSDIEISGETNSERSSKLARPDPVMRGRTVICVVPGCVVKVVEYTVQGV